METLALDAADVLACCRAVLLPPADTIAESLTATYRRWDIRNDPELVDLGHAFVDQLGARGEPLGHTCIEAAERVTRWRGYAYHSACHHAEVATNTMVIATIARRRGDIVRNHDRLLILAASLAHDLDYDNSRAGAPPYEMEAISAQALDTIAAKCGVVPADRQILRCLILATWPGFRANLRAILAGRRPRNPIPAPLRPIQQHARLAAILSDADLLSSVGLTEQWHEVQRDRLQRETGRPIRAKDDAAFIETIVGPGFLSPGARYFDTNLARIRATIHAAV